MKSPWRLMATALALGIASILSIACGASDTETAPTTSGASDTEVAPTASAEPLAEDANAPARPQRNSRFVPLDNPDFVTADTATFLQPDDRVLGLAVNGESRAYPISMMTFHHVANDVLGGQPVLVTF